MRIVSLALMGCLASQALPATAQAEAETKTFRDLNHNGRLDPYEDKRLTDEVRVDDLLKRMTIEEKVGTMMHATLPSRDPLGHDGDHYDAKESARLIGEAKVTSFITRLAVAPDQMARENNAVQRIAEGTRLGIPLTLSSDPRNHFQAVFGASTKGGGFSLWPETLGLAAIGDLSLVRRFGEIARREYRATGIHMALSPQADLATEPRWPRTTATFGSDPKAVSRLVGAYIEGFQGSRTGLTRNGVAAVVKHWVGYGAQPEGFDGHNYYGRVARLDNASFAQHVSAFDDALAFRTAGVMPTYPVIEGVTLDGRPLEPVGAGFNHQLLTDLLRDKKGYRGLILSDWAITNDCPTSCSAPARGKPQGIDAIAMPWGVEAMSKEDRFAKGVNAGIDQFGGVADSAILLAAYRAGKISLTHINASVRRVLMIKFQLGLFDNPYVDEAAALKIVNDPDTHAEAAKAQRRAQIVLENKGGFLPVAAGRKVWLYKVDPADARAHGFTVVEDLALADLAILRVDAPFEMLHPYHFFGSRQNEGRLDFQDGQADYEAIKRASAAVPTAVAINLDRPAILTNIRDKVQLLIATFGASDAAILDVIVGNTRAEGKLPFELPSGMAALEKQDPAVPDDSEAPLYSKGH
ncbi:glycoside hydrolase family 3 protein [Sphingobium nicotianae]|uniref:beta-glucosidase n=1 Tax=Sphingobium nicotianae TaxID=2782607 RepID=A0A9X1D9Z3_9SPHN|nr:glycoside hydrolase family 3 N-terminal domain-containing protein [Sphingobium nicotianae]MBT2186098.1 glycoside hydrolase family 3 protein [Sphingobium nicotianae]